MENTSLNQAYSRDSILIRSKLIIIPQLIGSLILNYGGTVHQDSSVLGVVDVRILINSF